MSLSSSKEVDFHHLNDLMMQAKHGDSHAFSVIYETFFTPVFRYLYQKVEDRGVAEDLTQTVFMKAFRSISKFKSQDKSPLAYFFTIARNTFYDYCRTYKKHQSDPLEDYEEVLPSTEDSTGLTEKNLKRKALDQALKLLKGSQAEVLRLRYIYDLSNSEIAQMLKVSEANVRQMQSRGMKALQKNIDLKNYLS